MGKTLDDDRYLVPGLVRAIAMLESFDTAGGALGLSELARAMSTTRSAAFRLAYTLTELGLLRQDRVTRAYSIGPGTAALGARYGGDRALINAGLPVLEALRDDTGLAAQLGVLEGADVTYLLRLAGVHAASGFIRAGMRLPAASTAMGRVLLAAMPDAALRDWHAQVAPRRLPWPAIASRAAQDAVRGFVIHLGEFQRGIGSVAVPLRAGVALSLAGPVAAIRRDGEGLARRLIGAASDITRFRRDASG